MNCYERERSVNCFVEPRTDDSKTKHNCTCVIEITFICDSSLRDATASLVQQKCMLRSGKRESMRIGLATTGWFTHHSSFGDPRTAAHEGSATSCYFPYDIWIALGFVRSLSILLLLFEI